MQHKTLSTILTSCGFKQSDVLAQLINVAPNPDVALEMLLGVHVPMVLSQYYSSSDRKTMYEPSKLNELEDMISYTSFEQKRKTIWYLSKEDYNNGVYVTERPKDYHTWSTIPDKGYKTTEVTEKIGDFFRKCKPIDTMEFFCIIQDWDHFEEVSL